MSFYVNTLFTSILVPVALQIINSKISTCINFMNIYRIPTEKNVSGSLNSLSTNSSSIRILSTITGYSHWFICLPIIANIYLEHFKSLAIPTSPTLIKWCFRYVNDGHSTTRKDQINKLKEHLNSIVPDIKFTIELKGMDGFPFLDTLVKPTPSSTESTFCRKPINRDRHLDYNFNHPISENYLLSTPSSKELNKYVLHLTILQKKWITFTKSYRTNTTQHSSFNKANLN